MTEDNIILDNNTNQSVDNQVNQVVHAMQSVQLEQSSQVQQVNQQVNQTNNVENVEHTEEKVELSPDEQKSVNIINALLKKNNGMDIRITQQQIGLMVNAVEDILNGNTINKINMMRVAVTLMSVTKKMKKLTNCLKKKLLMTTLEYYIAKQDGLTDEEKGLLLTLLQETISEAIDVVAEVKAGKLFSDGKKLCCFS